MLSFTAVLENVAQCNSVAGWRRLFLFSTNCLKQPVDGDYKSLYSAVKEMTCLEGLWLHPPIQPMPSSHHDPLVGLGRCASNKIEMGGLKGTIRLASSDKFPRFNLNIPLLTLVHVSPHPLLRLVKIWWYQLPWCYVLSILSQLARPKDQTNFVLSISGIWFSPWRTLLLPPLF